MGILCDLFVATRGEALRYESSLLVSPAVRKRKYAPVEIRGLGELELDKLLSILEHDDESPPTPRLHIMATSTDESWLLELNAKHVELLSSLDVPSISAVAKQWSDGLGGLWDMEEARTLVGRLVGLAGRALREDKNLYIWGSL